MGVHNMKANQYQVGETAEGKRKRELALTPEE